jgi:hypothetical protein
MADRPGYEWTHDGPVVSVRPVGANADSENWLNSPVERFETSGLTMAETLTALGRTIAPGFSGSHVTARPDADELLRLPAAIRVPSEAAFARRFSVRVAGVTVRQALDAIVAAHGESGWIAAFRGPRPTRAASRVSVVFWSVGSILVRTDTPPISPTTVPASRRGPMVSLPLTARRLSVELARLGLAAGRPMGQVLADQCSGGTGQGMLDLRDTNFDDGLRGLLAQCPGHVAESRAGVIVVAPPGALEREKILKVKIRSIRVTELPAAHVLWSLSEAITGLKHAPMREPPLTTLEARTSWHRPVTLSLKNVSVLDVLNELVKAHGALSWIVSSNPSGDPMIGLLGEYWGQSVSARRR